MRQVLYIQAYHTVVIIGSIHFYHSFDDEIERKTYCKRADIMLKLSLQEFRSDCIQMRIESEINLMITQLSTKVYFNCRRDC